MGLTLVILGRYRGRSLDQGIRVSLAGAEGKLNKGLDWKLLETTQIKDWVSEMEGGMEGIAL